MSLVLRHVIESITSASAAHRAEAMRWLRGTGPMFDRLGGQLAAAQHGPPRAARRTLVIAAGDHGAADPGIEMGEGHPTLIAARAIDGGAAAVRQLARAARAEVLLLDCGCAESARMPAGAVAVGRRPSGDARQAAALTIVEATAAIEAGIAVAVSLAGGDGGEASSSDGGGGSGGGGSDGGSGSTGSSGGWGAGGSDVLGLGVIGLGGELAAAAVAGALLGPARLPQTLPAEDRALAERAHQLGETLGVLEVLAAFGGPETATLTGVILAAASMNVPVVLDGEATGAAALLAARMAPAAAGYLIASQHGQGCMPAIVTALGLEAIFAGGVGHGEGAGAAMVLGLLDQVLVPCRGGEGKKGRSSGSGP